MRSLQRLKWIAPALLAVALAWFGSTTVRQDDDARAAAALPAETQRAPRDASGSLGGMSPLERPESARHTERKRMVGENIGPQTCEVIPVQGAHAAADVEEARAGAAEDVRDVCPSNLVSHVLENCVEHMVQNAEGVLERQYRCLQKGSCRICGDDLARRNELLL